MELALGSWALIKTTPSLLALIPLLAYLVMVFMNKSNLAGLIVGVIVAAILTGQGIGSLASIFNSALGSFLGTIGLIIMFGSGLGYLMNKSRVSHTMVYWIVKKIGVNSEKKGMLAIIVSSIVICGLLGTLAGGNAVIAPVIIPLVAAVGLTPTAVASLLRVSGEVGLMVGPLTGVTIATMEVTGLSYGKLMLWAVIPFSLVWLGSTWFAVLRIQKKYRGKEVYELTDDMVDLNSVEITKEEKRTTILFLLSFILLVAYGIIAKQGTEYAIIVMLILSLIIAISSRMKIDEAIDEFVDGASQMTNMFLVFIFFEAMFSMINLGGGFEAAHKVCIRRRKSTSCDHGISGRRVRYRSCSCCRNQHCSQDVYRTGKQCTSADDNLGYCSGCGNKNHRFPISNCQHGGTIGNCTM